MNVKINNFLKKAFIIFIILFGGFCAFMIIIGLIPLIYEDPSSKPTVYAPKQSEIVVTSVFGAYGAPLYDQQILLDDIQPASFENIRWIKIPAGVFWMGGLDIPVQFSDIPSAYPRHQVYLETYWISETEITNAQYQVFVDATQHPPPEHWENGQYPEGLANHPVVYVTYRDAAAFASFVGEKIGYEVFLPSEAEWEKAARGSEQINRYPWGDEYDDLKGNFGGKDPYETTAPVGSFPEGASPYGLLDMGGNVWEMTRNPTPGMSYPINPNLEPLLDENHQDEKYMIIRGSGFRSRLAIDLSKRSNGAHSNRVGFRLVISPYPLQK